MSRLHNGLIAFFLILSIICTSLSPTVSSAAKKEYVLVILSCYRTNMNIGEECYLLAVTSNGSIPTFKSSNSKIASVNSYGLITAKASGSCKITAKASSGEASCKVTVNKTKITLNRTAVSLENNGTFRLIATTSNGSEATYKSSKKSVATIDENGIIYACTPGTSTITVTADKTTARCKVTVKKPSIELNRYTLSLYRGQTFQMKAVVSSGISPVWKSSQSSVATVDENGLVTARKNGTAYITAKVDGVSRICELTVEPPEITLSAYDITLKTGETYQLNASVSSGNKPRWKSKKSSIASVTQNGLIRAKKAGTTLIGVTEDGTTETCTVHVVTKK